MVGAHVLDATLGTPGGATLLVGPVVVQVESVTAMAPRATGGGGRCVAAGQLLLLQQWPHRPAREVA